jgi:DNA invertase Pin-like site-specific DNA recombinase
VQLEKLNQCDWVFKEKRSGLDRGRPALKQCLEFLREGDTLLVTKIDRLARSTSDLYRVVSKLSEKGVSFKVIDDPSIDTTSRTGKLVMGILALIAEFENDIRRERQMDGIKKAREDTATAALSHSGCSRSSAMIMLSSSAAVFDDF